MQYCSDFDENLYGLFNQKKCVVRFINSVHQQETCEQTFIKIAQKVCVATDGRTRLLMSNHLTVSKMCPRVHCLI